MIIVKILHSFDITHPFIMFFNQNRNQLRRAYYDAWIKFTQKQPMTMLEQQISKVINEHPEYHSLIENIERDYSPEEGQSNPFLHMGMHLALREQVATNRPAGIHQCHATLSLKLGSSLDAEHQMMECLGQALWEAQQQGTPPDEAKYLNCLKKISDINIHKE